MNHKIISFKQAEAALPKFQDQHVNSAQKMRFQKVSPTASFLATTKQEHWQMHEAPDPFIPAVTYYRPRFDVVERTILGAHRYEQKNKDHINKLQT